MIIKKENEKLIAIIEMENYDFAKEEDYKKIIKILTDPEQINDIAVEGDKINDKDLKFIDSYIKEAKQKMDSFNGEKVEGLEENNN